MSIRENKYSVTSPTRVDLAGGLLDIWPVHALVQDCFVVNFSIPVFTSVELKCPSLGPRLRGGDEPHGGDRPSREACHSGLDPESRPSLEARHSGLDPESRHSRRGGNPDNSKIDIKVSSPSGMYEKSFSDLQALVEEAAPELDLLKKHLEYWESFFEKGNSFNEVNNISFLSLKSESPVGGGLGGSSSLCVGLAKAFCSLFKKDLTQNELLNLCRDLEASLLHTPAGIQDYIPAMESDPDCLYIIELTPLGPKWKKRKAPLDFFKNHFLLVDTGKSHHSGNNNWEILKKIIEKDPETLNGVYELRDNALKMVEICEKEDWPDLSFSLNREQELRGKYFSNWLNPSVSSVIDLMKGEGTEAVKLCGAGGGGFLIVLAKNKAEKKKLEKICEKNNIPVIMNW